MLNWPMSSPQMMRMLGFLGCWANADVVATNASSKPARPAAGSAVSSVLGISPPMFVDFHSVAAPRPDCTRRRDPRRRRAASQRNGSGRRKATGRNTNRRHPGRPMPIRHQLIHCPHRARPPTPASGDHPCDVPELCPGGAGAPPDPAGPVAQHRRAGGTPRREALQPDARGASSRPHSASCCCRAVARCSTARPISSASSS